MTSVICTIPAMTQSCFHKNQTVSNLVIVTTLHSFPVRREEEEGRSWRGRGEVEGARV